LANLEGSLVDTPKRAQYLSAMDLKKLITQQGMKVLQDPRVMKVMQDERVMKAMMQAFQMRGKAQESFDEAVEKMAKRLGLVTKKEVRELKRSMRKLETELKKAQKENEKRRAPTPSGLKSESRRKDDDED
jgi:hypothetical protein